MNYFKNLFMEKKKKVIDFFANFYISHESDIKIFLKLSINKFP